ncbi:MAG: nuclear transport factor 2 family protein [Candidatus Acidiferrales bacterium]
MRRRLVLGFGLPLLVLIPLSLSGQKPEGKAPGAAAGSLSSRDQRVIDNESAVWEAVKQKDAMRFDQLVADDARIIFDTGILTKSEFLSSLPDRTILDYHIGPFTVLHPDNQTVILIYKATRSGTYKGRAFPATAVHESSVWVLRKGKWVAVLNQETPIAP